ncbi:GTPase Era, mitochondrial isoform X2 [Nasonia vitripennis]|uniref:G domain-containing protein n=1 Tax=Nasonia vitripennis TaxID=7425 RepID=A0A7M7IZN9_NASVI|nr:GTPase Era, mitochondrial isoform X2 [Nasonia vitripennis]
MWICISKKAARAGAQIVRQVSNFADDLGESLIEAKKVFLNDQDNKKNVKSLKIAILGLPNAGKSTLINHLIGRPVCATSSKIHTTRKKASAIFCLDDTQLVFIDTPGLVGRGDGVDDLRNYFLDSAKERTWEYNKKTYSDQTPDTIVQEIVKAKFLDDLPQELPYLVDVVAEHVEKCEDGSMNVVVNVNCPSARIARMIIGRSGERVKKVAKEAEQVLCTTFTTAVRLKIAIPIKEEPLALEKQRF